jgi:hypothetical protein
MILELSLNSLWEMKLEAIEQAFKNFPCLSRSLKTPSFILIAAREITPEFFVREASADR